MYFWNIKALSKDLKLEVVSESDKFLYFLIFSLDILFFLEQNSSYPEWILTNLLTSLIIILIIIIGTYVCYQSNKEGDNKNFMERMVCLSLPIGLRFLVLSLIMLPIMYLISIIITVGVSIYRFLPLLTIFKKFALIPGFSQAARQQLDSTLFLLLNCVSLFISAFYFYFINRTIKEIARNE